MPSAGWEDGHFIVQLRHISYPQRAPRLAADANGLIYLPETAFAAAFAQNATAKELAVLAAVQRPLSKDRPTNICIQQLLTPITGDTP
ncbi:MAG: hypothetical protein ACREPU_05680 [Rhodanobacteraceae bacterium]